MANRQEGFDEEILYCAKEEFLEKGYDSASLRTIAKNAGVSTSTIYTRYVDKEGLFSFLVEPAVTRLLSYVESYLGDFMSLGDEKKAENRISYSEKGIKGFVDIIYENMAEFKMIVSGANNILHRQFFEKLIDLDEACTVNFLKASKNSAWEKGEIDRNLIRILSSGFYAGLMEIVRCDMEKEAAVKYVEELKAFYERGWSRFFNA